MIIIKVITVILLLYGSFLILKALKEIDRLILKALKEIDRIDKEKS